ncbi:hypothetical protein FQR65_LT19869 [Abscondita terminalis]|nr:hypothetical protein FQR65_LT19869 [Abscondita terminalis]
MIISPWSPVTVNRLNAHQLNKKIAEEGCLKDEPVRLDACRTGLGKNSIAQQLSGIRACNQNQNLENTFTLGTGIEVVDEENKCDGPYERIKPTILKLDKEKAYIVSLTDFFSCAEHENAYLKLMVSQKASLVIYGETEE